ncbi:MAG: hypothetical protein QM741_11045 [Rudaea sp.]|uniref:hypothetical protein n=1 Tax=Rudaea sp. TaxID=2136325 RepID=UPI0039E5E6C7
MSDPTRPNRAGELNAADPIPLGDALRALPQLAPAESAWADLVARLAADDDAGTSRPSFPQANPVNSSFARKRGSSDFALTGRTGKRRKKLDSPFRGNEGRRITAWPIGIAAALVLAFSAAAVLRLRPTHVPAANAATQIAATETPTGASSVHNATNSQNAAQAASDGLVALQARSRSLERWLRDTGTASMPHSAQDLAASMEIEDMIGLVDVQLGAGDAGNATATRSLWKRRVALLEDLSALRYGAKASSLRDGLVANGASADAMNATPAVWRN